LPENYNLYTCEFHKLAGVNKFNPGKCAGDTVTVILKFQNFISGDLNAILNNRNSSDNNNNNVETCLIQPAINDAKRHYVFVVAITIQASPSPGHDLGTLTRRISKTEVENTLLLHSGST
jgi:hypothetical protein